MKNLMMLAVVVAGGFVAVGCTNDGSQGGIPTASWISAPRDGTMKPIEGTEMATSPSRARPETSVWPVKMETRALGSDDKLDHPPAKKEEAIGGCPCMAEENAEKK